MHASLHEVRTVFGRRGGHVWACLCSAVLGRLADRAGDLEPVEACYMLPIDVRCELFEPKLAPGCCVLCSAVLGCLAHRAGDLEPIEACHVLRIDVCCGLLEPQPARGCCVLRTAGAKACSSLQS